MEFGNRMNPMRQKSLTKEELRNRNLAALMDRTGYPIMQLNGQRIFGPPRQWMGPPPTRGCEIFVGKIPKFIFEDELVPIFERVGRIYQMRLMMDFSGMNRGYAFVTYMNPAHATMAVTHLNNYEIRPTRHIGVYKSVDNCRLFVGSIPTQKSRYEVGDVLSDYVEGIVDIIMYPGNSVNGETRNRGYVFVEFESHRAAAIARRLLGSGVKFWDTPVAVDWAEPLPEVDPAIMQNVTILYIRNLDMWMDSKELQLHLGNYIPIGMIGKVHKTSDYAFVHFHSRSDAENAFVLLAGKYIKGNQIEVAWARPRIYSREQRLHAPAENFCTSVPPRMRRLVQKQRSSECASSSSSLESYSPIPSPPNVNRNYCYVNMQEPYMNIVNYNVVATNIEENDWSMLLPSFQN